MAGRADVVRIEAGASRGTGFLIDDRRVMTALHVIGKVEDGKLCLHGTIKVTAAVATHGRFRLPVCVCAPDSVIAFEAGLDWACIAIDREAFDGVVSLAIRDVAAADQNATWHTYGFPDGAPIDGKATSGTIVSTAALLRLPSAQLRVVQVFSNEAGTGGFVRGYSGSPVMVDGHAVAVMSVAQQDEAARSVEGTMYAIPMTTLRERLGGDTVTVPEAELCLVEHTAGSIRLAGCLVTDDPSALADEIQTWRTKASGDPWLPAAVKARVRNAALRELFDEPAVRHRLLELVSVGSFALYAYYTTASDADRVDNLAREALAHRLRKKRQRIVTLHARGDITAPLDAAIAMVEREQGRTLVRPVVKTGSPLVVLASALFAIVARKLAEPASDAVEAEFVYLRTKTRLALDVITHAARTRDSDPL